VRASLAVVVTRRAEGFGLPALEGMACGVPVVAFDNTSLPEVVGDGGVLVPDGDVSAMADAVSSLLVDEALRSALVARGIRRASMFDWARCAQALGDILIRAAVI
jgi:alpha-1,3-rhamnosyl/mannosyltransferase